jgi:hypothetical protein
MFLTSVQGIRELLGFDDMTDINAAIEGALHAAEPQLAALLDTSFDRAGVTDIFWAYEPGFRQGPHVRTEFRLSRGFLAADPLVVMASSVAALGSASATVLCVRADREKGVVHDWTTRFREDYIQAAYEAGFEVDAANPLSYDLTQVPAWLQEAAKLKTLYGLADSPTLSEAGVKLDVRSLDAQYAAVVNTHLRYAPSSLLPV